MSGQERKNRLWVTSIQYNTIAVCAQLLLLLYYKQNSLNKYHFLVGDQVVLNCSYTTAEVRQKNKLIY